MIPRLTDSSSPTPLYAEFLAELRARGFAGDLSSTYADRTVLATDNSIYQRMPEGIAFPKDTEDLVRIARVLADPRFAGLKVAPRGGGTGTNGQSLTDGVVVDVSRHMNRIIEINPARRWDGSRRAWSRTSSTPRSHRTGCSSLRSSRPRTAPQSAA